MSCGLVELRGSELLAALCVGAILIGALWAGFPLLQDRVSEVLFYSVSCLAAVLLRIALDLMVWAGRTLKRGLQWRIGARPAVSPKVTSAV